MRVLIAKVDETLYDGEAQSLTVPGAEGELTALSNHVPLITTLKSGTIRVRETKDSKPLQFPIESGILEINHRGATVIL